MYPASKVRPRKVKTIRALDRGLEVLEVLLASSACSLRELHRTTRLSKATLTRILMTLAKRGLVWQRLADDAWVPSHTLRANAARFGDDGHLLEVTGPILEALCERAKWPSVLAVPRLRWMEVIETNSPRAYFHEVPLGPVGFRIPMLRSATGRAYLAWCADGERATMLERLRLSQEPEDAGVHDPRAIEAMLEQTRRQGYSQRDAHFAAFLHPETPNPYDEYSSIAVPIIVDQRVIGCVNLVWVGRVATPAEMAARHLTDLKDAAAQIVAQMQAPAQS